MVRCLLSLVPKADVPLHVRARDPLDRDALFLAVQNFHAPVALELLQNFRADPDRPSAHGHHFATTPLGVAV